MRKLTFDGCLVSIELIVRQTVQLINRTTANPIFVRLWLSIGQMTTAEDMESAATSMPHERSLPIHIEMQ